MLFSAVLRAAPYIPLILYFATSLVFLARSDSDLLRFILCCVGSFAIYFYFAWVVAALLNLTPTARLAAGAALPAGLFLILAALDALAPALSGGGFISFQIQYKALWAIPGMFLSRPWFR